MHKRGDIWYFEYTDDEGRRVRVSTKQTCEAAALRMMTLHKKKREIASWRALSDKVRDSPTEVEIARVFAKLNRLLCRALTNRVASECQGELLSTLKQIGRFRKRITDRLRKHSEGSAGRNRTSLRILNRDEQHRLLAVLIENGDERLNLLVHLILLAGIRSGEAILLRWADFDRNRMMVKSRSVRQARWVPISSKLRAVLDEHLAWFREKYREPEGDDFLFPSPANAKEPVHSFRQGWQRLIIQAEVQCTLHDLRRTFIANLAETAYSLPDVRAHAKPGPTLVPTELSSQ